jgi:nitrogen regulatory protein P-II 1
LLSEPHLPSRLSEKLSFMLGLPLFQNLCLHRSSKEFYLTRVPYIIAMKRIEIIIPHRELKEAHEILKNVNTGGMSYYTIEGSGRIKADPIFIGRGTMQTQPEYIPRTKIEVVVKDDQVEELISKITDTLGKDLGGKIFVVDVPIAVDIRTKKRGDAAI